MRDAALAQNAGVMSIRILETCGRPQGDQPTYERLADEVTVLHRIWLRTAALPSPTQAAPDPVVTARLARHIVDLESYQWRQVDEARFVLSRAGRAALPLIERALGASEPYLRQHALEVLRALGPPGAALSDLVKALLQLPESRVEAIRTLGAIGERSSIPALIALLSDADPEVRCAVAGALGPLRAFRASAPLNAILGAADRSMDLRVQAAFSLAILEPQGEGLEFLLQRRRAGDYHTPTIDELIAAAVATR
jgi:HEAT repeat protein